MTRAFVISLGLVATLLAACSAPPQGARIVVFTASAERIPRGAEVTLAWEAADAGVQEGIPSCVLTRWTDDEATEATLRTTCSGSVTDVPTPSLAATVVEYRLKVLKQPYDPADPYLAQARSVTLDAALYATRAGGPDLDSAESVSSLPDGGAIIAGRMFGTATFGTTTLTSAGLQDAFVARIQADGTWAWAQSAGGTLFDVALGVSTVVDGGAIVTGHFAATADFGTTTLTSTGLSDAFVARIDPDGTWAWATRAGGTGADMAFGVSALPDGGALVTGYVSGTASFGTIDLTSAGGDDVFVARILPNGTWAWATSAGGPDFDGAESVSTLTDGGAIIAGRFAGTATFGATTLTSAGGDDVFVARIQPDGTWSWAQRAGGMGGDQALGVSLLANGSAIVAGAFDGTATFGTTTLIGAGSDDVFVARIEPDGTWSWAKSAGGPGFDGADSVGTVPDGGAIIAGRFDGTATFGTTTLTSAGGTDAFVARLDPDGTWAWATAAGGTSSERAQSVSTLADGGGIISGYFDDTATFGSTTLTSAGDRDAFVARIGADGAW